VAGAVGGLRAGRSSEPDGYEVAFLDEDGSEVRRPLRGCVGVAFEAVSSVRRFPSYRGQRNYPGFFYAATLDAHVGFESWLERDEAMALDFDPDIVGFASQPFWLFWPDTDRVRSHAPDFFARRSDGTGVVIDCRPKGRIGERDEMAFAATGRVCAEVGWQFRLVTGHDPVWLSNVRWLAGYRHRRHWVEPVASRLLEVVGHERPLMEAAAAAGDLIAVLPVLFHLMWCRRLRADLSQRLDAGTLVRRAER
jgi:hypothetical protein